MIVQGKYSVKNAGHTAGHIEGQSGIRQGTSVMASTAVAEVKSINQATRVVKSAALADRQCRDQATQDASISDQSSIEVWEAIEAVPHHEFFIQEL